MSKNILSGCRTNFYVKIDKANNGFIMENDNGECCVYEFIDDLGLHAMQALLSDILDYFGMSGTKHDSERLRIIIDKLDKEEDND